MKRKANNPLKRKQAMAKSFLKDLAVVRVVGSDVYANIYNVKTCKPVNVTRQLADFMSNMTWQWYIDCSVVCRSQSGEDYIVSESVKCESAYRQSDPRLNDFLNEHHKAFLAKQNPLHVVTLAWLAMPALGDKNEVDLQTLYKIYANENAFEHLSKWEQDKL